MNQYNNADKNKHMKGFEDYIIGIGRSGILYYDDIEVVLREVCDDSGFYSTWGLAVKDEKEDRTDWLYAKHTLPQTSSEPHISQLLKGTMVEV